MGIWNNLYIISLHTIFWKGLSLSKPLFLLGQIRRGKKMEPVLLLHKINWDFEKVMHFIQVCSEPKMHSLLLSEPNMYDILLWLNGNNKNSFAKSWKAELPESTH